MNAVNQLKWVLNALNQLRRDTKHMVSMEMHHGMGDVLVRTYSGLHQIVSQVVDTPFVSALVVDLPEDADDRQKVTLVSLLSGQLLAFVEAQYNEMRDVEEDSQNLSEEERIQQRFNKLMDNE